jgi:glutamyl-tRNA synthetase
VPVGDAVFLEPDDAPAAGERVWLKGLGPYRAADGGLTATDDDIAAVREEGVPVVHWVPAEGGVDVRLRTPTGDETGVAEPAFAGADADEVVQFERVGFARVDAPAPDAVAYFAHR